MVERSNWDGPWTESSDDTSVMSEITLDYALDTDIHSECSTVFSIDDGSKRWSLRSSSPTRDYLIPLSDKQRGKTEAAGVEPVEQTKRGSITSTTESSKDTAPLKPERKGSSHDRTRGRRSRHRNCSTSSHSTYRTMVTISEEGEESPSSDSSHGRPSRSHKRHVNASKKQHAPFSSSTTNRESLKKLMKEFLDSVTENNYMSGGSDTDESTERKKEKKNIKNFISKSLRRRAEPDEGKHSDTDSIEGSKGGGSTMSQPTPQMMEVIERLSVQAALVMTSSTRKHEEEDYAQPSKRFTSRDDFGGSFSSISSTSSLSGHSHRDRPDGTHQEVNRVPGLEEESSVSTSSHSSPEQSSSGCSSSQTMSQDSISTLKSSPRRRQATIDVHAPSSSPYQHNKRSCGNPVQLTPQMKGLIERLSVKAALSVISQKECSLIQDAVLDHSRHSSSSEPSFSLP